MVPVVNGTAVEEAMVKKSEGGYEGLMRVGSKMSLCGEVAVDQKMSSLLMV